MSKFIVGNYCYKIDVGRVRNSNEDQAKIILNANGRILMIVCDGMGGQNHGELASRLAVEIIEEEFLKCPYIPSKGLERFWLRNAIKKANNAIFNEALQNSLYKGMGTTLTAVLLAPKHITVAQIGDSRAYMLKDGQRLEQITSDQTYVAYLARVGNISEEELKNHPKRHVLLNALGIYPSLSCDLKTIKYNGEHILVCSDGLFNNIPNHDLESIIRTNESPQQKTDQLISLANANGGSDNIAVAYWEADRHGR